MVYGFNKNDDDYSQIVRFVNECNNITYSQFDNYTTRGLNLFAIRENYDFDGVEKLLDEIIDALPAIKRIFAKPITRLKDMSEIMPVESVKVVNSRTIIHASGHSELWDDITEEGLRPKKLLTISNEDNYTIYENIVFVRTIDIIRSIVGKNIRIIRDMLYDHRDLQFNLLERENHLEYFLAVGKLHIGYIRHYEKYRYLAERCFNKLMFIDGVIRSRLGTIIYKKCRGNHGKLTLKKTNVFRNHKDYYKIYKLIKMFSDMKISDTEVDDHAFFGTAEGYMSYVSMISLFAVGHFNFKFEDDVPIDFNNLNQLCRFGNWRMTIDTIKLDDSFAIRFVLFKEVQYSIILIPCVNVHERADLIEKFKLNFQADEYILACPDGGEGEHMYLSLFDVESFRRVQQMVLRGMIYADNKRDVCPFCGDELNCDEYNTEVYYCQVCHTQITNCICNNTDKSYIITEIKNYKPKLKSFEGVVLRDKQLYMRQLEEGLHFRNITNIKENARAVCPHCGELH